MKHVPLLLREMLALRNDEAATGMMRFFKTGQGEYGEGDRFLGVRVPVTRAVVKRIWRETTMEDLEVCIASSWHEVRLAALLTLNHIYKNARKDPTRQRACIDFYLSHTDGINNWDLVDLSCYELLGSWLLDKDRRILYDMAREDGKLWRQRIAIVTTMQFLRHGETRDTYALADILMCHPHDLIHKAVGWLLREAGKRNEAELIAYLGIHAAVMPRTMLRYAIERLPDSDRSRLLAIPRQHR